MIKSWHSNLCFLTEINFPVGYMRAAILCRTDVNDLGVFINLQMEKEDSS